LLLHLLAYEVMAAPGAAFGRRALAWWVWAYGPDRSLVRQ
jgi:hypothetical protein